MLEQKCSEIYCNHWVQDSQDADHYMCLKCDRHRWIRGEPNNFNPISIVFSIVAIVFLVTLLLGCENTDHRPPVIRSQVSQPIRK